MNILLLIVIIVVLVVVIGLAIYFGMKMQRKNKCVSSLEKSYKKIGGKVSDEDEKNAKCICDNLPSDFNMDGLDDVTKLSIQNAKDLLSATKTCM